MNALHYRSRILMGGAIVLMALVAAFAFMGAILPATNIEAPSNQPRVVQHVEPDTALTIERAVRTARSHGVDSTFLAQLSASPATTIHLRSLKINITNFAKKTSYAHNHNAASVRKVRDFMQAHDSVLSACSAEFGVPVEVIAAILWVETKFGTVMGSIHVPSVYLSLMLSDDSTLVHQYTNVALQELNLDSTRYDSIRTIIKTKATKKRLWAAEQLKALDTIHRSGTMNVMTLHGSWAGAFGLSQFIPSSYRRWAVDGNEDAEIDLTHLSDAIHSIANYLVKNGWGPTAKQRRTAVRHYNNSDAYVDAVFTLAEKVQTSQAGGP